MTVEGGPALPISIDEAASTVGGPALRVQGYTPDTVDRPVQGGPAQRVKVLTSADLVENGGAYRVEGRVHAIPVVNVADGRPVAGGPAIAIYPVNGDEWPVVPVTPPLAPSGLTAQPVSTAQINLVWVDNSDNEDGFRIERSLNGITWAELDTVAAGVEAFSDTTITAGVSYRYRVIAYNAGGDSDPSSTATSNTLLLGLVAYWKLDEASGARIDSVGGNNLTDNGSTGATTGKIGNAALFDPALSQNLSIADNASLSIGAGVSLSLSLWIYHTGTGSRTILNKGFNPVGGGYLVYLLDDDRVLWRIYDGSDQPSVLSAILTASTWYHVVVTYNVSTTTMRIYINNGTPAELMSGPASIPNDTGTFRIGAFTVGGDYFDGRIDEVGFWKRVLVASEITALYNDDDGTTYPFS